MKEIAPGVIVWSGYREPAASEEVIESTEVSEDTAVSDEREELKAKLKDAGVPFGGNTSLAKLRAMVEALG